MAFPGDGDGEEIGVGALEGVELESYWEAARCGADWEAEGGAAGEG